jgi:hypothetical protein
MFVTTSNLNRAVSSVAALLTLYLLPATPVAADNSHYIGFTYASGAREVWDWHDDNISLDDEDTGVLPMGLSYRYTSQFRSGLRSDFGVGPFVVIYGDVSYLDMPVQATLGYTFARHAHVRPYARLGASFHINEGDYVSEKAKFGALGAIGLEIGNPGSVSFFMEATYDSAKATFSTDEYESYWIRNESEEDIRVNDFLLTLGVKF